MKNYTERFPIDEMLIQMEKSIADRIPSASMKNMCYDSDIRKMVSRGLIERMIVPHTPFNCIYYRITAAGRKFALNVKARNSYAIAYQAMRVYHHGAQPSLLMSDEAANRFDAYNYAMMHIYDGNQHTVADDNAFRSWHMRKAKDSLDTLLIHARDMIIARKSAFYQIRIQS